MNTLKSKLYVGAVVVIFILSFRCYSALYYPILNSDHAVSILMLHDLHLPQDFYFWGQDRIGSLIPVLGQVFFKGFHLSAITSEAITHYLILLIGFLALSTFVRSLFYKLVLCLVWFFPPMRFIDVIALYSGVEYSLIAMACYLYVQLQRRQAGDFLMRTILSLSIVFLLLAAVWVSDMAVITIAVLLFLLLVFRLKNGEMMKSMLYNSEFLYAVAGIVAGLVFFHYAKAHSPNRLNYATFSDAATVKAAAGILWGTVSDLLAFQGDELLTSVYCYLLLLTAALVLLFKKHPHMSAERRLWFRFFLLDAIAVFVIILASQWTFLNGVPRRYFTCTYISLAMAFIIWLDHANFSLRASAVVKVVLILTVLVGGAGTIYNLKFFWPRTLVPKADIVREFESLGKIGVIAEYWNAYIVACTDPDKIKATPHDKEYVRNPEMAEAVFRQERIYIIKDMWLKDFPDTLQQFGHSLVRSGSPFHLGDCDVCRYYKVK